MTDLKDRVIIVTGASDGIGKAIAKSLASVGARVVFCARNLKKLEEIAHEVNKELTGELFPFKCDVSKEEDVLSMFKFVEEKFGTLHGIVNNAGLVAQADLLTGKTELWQKLLDIHVIGTAMCSREAIRLMRKFGIDDGHVLNINSTIGHMVINIPITHMYSASKFALRAMAEGLRQELRSQNSRIRVSEVSPGLVKSNIYEKALPENPEIVKGIYSSYECIVPEDVAQAVLYVLSTPSRVNISEMIVESYEETH